MTLGADTTTDEIIAVTLAEHPRVAASLAAAHVAAWSVVDPVVLDLSIAARPTVRRHG